MKSYSRTDIGNKRTMNQDSLYCSESPLGSFPNLFIVADGMGGHKAGDYASKLCIESMVHQITESSAQTPVLIFKDAITYANRSVYNMAYSAVEYNGMGTTMVTAMIQENTLYIANIGDSRLYLLQEELKQVTKDHSLVEEMVQVGDLTESEARVHPQKNIITRALGIDSNVEADFFEIPLKKEDVILLCSDGLSNMVDDEEIQYVLQHSKDLKEAGDTLVKKANDHGGMDNITVVLIKIDD